MERKPLNDESGGSRDSNNSSSTSSGGSTERSPPLLRPSFRDTKKHFGADPVGTKAPPPVRAQVPGAVPQSGSSSASRQQQEKKKDDPRISKFAGRTRSQSRLAEDRRLGRKLKHMQIRDLKDGDASVDATANYATSTGGGNRDLPRMKDERDSSDVLAETKRSFLPHGAGVRASAAAAAASLGRYNDNETYMYSREEQDELKRGSRGGSSSGGGSGEQRISLTGELIKQLEKKPSIHPQYTPRPAMGDPAALALGFSELGIPAEEPDLAVAVAVSSEEHRRALDGVQNMPVGVEFDPDAKPPMHRNRRCQFYGVVVSFVLCVLLISAGVILLKVESVEGGGIESFSPTTSPTSDAEGALKEQLARGVTYRVYLEGTPQWQAAEWMIHHDPLQLDPSAPNLLQRYVLVLFYIKTSAAGPWRSCNPSNTTGDSDCVFDQLFRNENDEIDYKQEAATAWLSYEHECKWVGVLCDDFDEVRTITLWGNNLSGTLPTELSVLPYLTSISLAYNRFTGRLPIDYATMKHISNIELHGNSLTGDIPETYYDTIGLKRLSVGENRLTGTISTRVGLMTNLKGLHIEKNLFRGTIPTEIGMLSELAFTRWNKNRFTGSVPTEFGVLRKLKELWLHANPLSGTLPSELGLLDDMNDLRIFSNSLTGTIPESIYDLVGIWRLDLMDMRLSGTLSTRLGQLTNLKEFRVRRNKLEGTVPTEIGLLKKLKLLWLHLNLFEGDIPGEICANVEPGELRYINADCGPLEMPAQSCPCCDGCCDRSNELCLLQGENARNQSSRHFL